MSKPSLNKNDGYRKFKTINNEANNNSQSSKVRKNKQDQFAGYFKNRNQDDGQWIGTQSTPPRPEYVIQNNYSNQSFEVKRSLLQSPSKLNNSNEQNYKSPTQLIQGILKGLSLNTKLNTISPYYTQQSQQKLTEILTSQSKLQAFISQLEMQAPEVQQQIAKNYQMLIILLKHISKSDVEVKHSSQGLELNFNKNTLVKQENQIQKLQKKIKQKDEHIKQIIEDYQSVIRNFHDVIQKLLDERLNGTNHHHQNNGVNIHNKRNFKN